jgi:hypothetical protein
MTTRQVSATPAGSDPGLSRYAPPRPGDREQMPPGPGEAARLARFLHDHPCWSVFWDKQNGVWRAAEDDPDSVLYIENRDLDRVIGYITARR